MVPRPRRMPRRARPFHVRQELQVQRPPERLPRLEHEARREGVQHRRNPAQMIGVAVRRDDQRHLPRAMPSQEWDHDAASRVRLRSAGATVDDDPATSRCPQRRRITLADVQEMYLQALTGVERGSLEH